MEKPLQQVSLGIGCDGSLLQCSDDAESLLLGLVCPSILYGQTRAQAGLGGCIPGCLAFFVPPFALALIAQVGVLIYSARLFECVAEYESCRFGSTSGDSSSDSGGDCQTCTLPWQVFTFGLAGGLLGALYIMALCVAC